MRKADAAAVRPLDPQRDRRQLTRFDCRDFRYPWTDVIEELVRGRLADSVESGESEGVVAVDGDTICAVAAYSIVEDQGRTVCFSNLLAVRMGFYRRGYGQALKQAVITGAWVAGAEAVVSTVHIDNDPMLDLNIKLGASVEQIAGDPEFRRCVIPV